MVGLFRRRLVKLNVLSIEAAIELISRTVRDKPSLSKSAMFLWLFTSPKIMTGTGLRLPSETIN